MVIKKLLLERFRLHSSLLLEFTKPTTVILGDNASGKTSIIEAIQLLATGNSFRAEKVQEMITFENELGRVKGIVEVETEQSVEELLSGEEQRAPEELELEVLLTTGEVQGRKTQHRLFSVNGVRRQKGKLVGQLKVVSFRPEDMRLVEGSPSRRREFLDMPLCLLFNEYQQALTNYENILKRRNRLLEAVREREQPRSVLAYWNMGLVKYGTILQQFRRDFIGSFVTVNFPYDFAIEYQPSVISSARQEEYLEREIASGHSLIGPHKDDFVVTMVKAKNERKSEAKTNFPVELAARVDVATYGSRGQQRLAVLWLKTCELAYITATTRQYPILLLDDILSELDPDSRSLVTELLGKTQAIVTTIEASGVALIQEKVGADNVQVVNL